MKYKLSLRKYWWTWFKQDLWRIYYSKIHKFNMSSYKGTMLPHTGTGKYISIYLKGKIIQIKHKSGYEFLEFDEIRLIPYQPNHGIMVERLKNGKLLDRNCIEFKDFDKIFNSKFEGFVTP